MLVGGMKSGALSLLFFTSISLSVCAQVDADAVKFSKYINVKSAREHLKVIASDDFEGRETGTRGAQKAADYLAAEMKKIGLDAPVDGSFFQQVELSRRVLTVNNFQVEGLDLLNLKDFYMRAAATVNVTGSTLVFAGYGIGTDSYDDLKGQDLSGKVVLMISRGEPRKDGVSLISGSAADSEWSRLINKRVDYIQSKGPSLILAVNPGLSSALKNNKDLLSSSRISINRNVPDAATPGAPVIQLTPEAADLFLKHSGNTLEKLENKINETGKPVSQVIPADFRISLKAESEKVSAVNVMGYLEGSDLRDELVVISAHYDHLGLNANGEDKVFNGADDDGSGTTAVLELAEAFNKAKKAGKGPRRSILFLFVVGEEKGLLGSEWYSEHPVFPLKNTVTDLNIDMIGRVDPGHKKEPDYCYLVGSDKLSSDLHRISENANSTYTKLTLDYKYNAPNDPEQIYFRSDHYNFAKHNIPVIFYFNGVHEDYHQPGDEVKKILFPLLVKRAQLVFFTAWDLVNREGRPVVDVK